jgi:AraC family transcriptional regulator of adaptative response / DNA-3-methyladenine glycosylase II
LRVTGGWDGFETAVRAVLGQQISIKGAAELAGRIVASLGMPLSGYTATTGVTHMFPKPERFNAKGLSKFGMTGARAKCLAGLAAAFSNDRNLFDPGRDLENAVARLRELPGVGEWTAQYIAMRALGECDAFLAADVGLQRGFAALGQRLTAPKLLARAERWRPWRAYAMAYLWTANADAARASLNKERYNALTA